MRVLRLLLFLLTGLAVLLAVVTTTGRVVVALLPRMETQLNTLLAGSGVELDGVAGAWHWLNPVVRIDKVRFNGGHARGVTLELDLVESAVHSAVVMRRLSAASIELTPVLDATGHWRLGSGGGNGPAVSLDALLRYSDGLDFPDVRIVFMPAEGADGVAAAPLGELQGRATFANTALRHSGEFVVRVMQGGSGELNLLYDVTQGIFGNPSSGRIALRSEHVMFAPAFGIALGGGGATIDTLLGDWSFAEGNSSGSLKLSARDIVLPTGALDLVDLSARGSMERFGLRWVVVCDQLDARGGRNSVRLDGAKFALMRPLKGGQNLEFSLPALDLAALSGVLDGAAGGVAKVDEWLTGLNPRGRLDRIVGRIDLVDRKLDFVGSVSNVALENFKGVPYVRNGAAAIAGTERGVEIRLDDKDIALGFLNFYDAPFRFDALSGDVLVWFRPGYLALHGGALEGVIGGMKAHGQFALGRPDDPLEQRFFAKLRVNDVDARTALTYVPNPLSVRSWLDAAVLAGRIDEADLLYHGHLRTVEDLPMRQVELRIRVHDSVVRFHPQWPVAENVSGQVLVTTAGTRGEFDRGSLTGIALKGASLWIPHALDAVEFNGTGSGDGASLRTLIDTSPLSTYLAFVKPEWTFAGPFDFSAGLRIPVKQAADPQVDLTLNFGGMDVVLANMNLPLGALRGPLRYRYPFDVQADRIDASLFGYPARFGVETKDGQLRIAFTGRAEARALTDWRNLPNAGVATGQFDFGGDYRIRPGTTEAPVLALKSDLVGVTLDLPPPLGKPAEAARPSTLAMTFAPDHTRVDARLGTTMRGWLRLLPEGGVHAGSIGIGVVPAPERGDEDAVTFIGGLAMLDLSQWFSGAPRSNDAGFAWALDEFRIGRVGYRSIGFDNVVADASGRDGKVELSITAPDLEGTVKIAPDVPAQIDLHYLKIPARDEAKSGDPLANVDARAIGDLDVVIDDVQLGAEDYGKWQFQTRRLDTGLAIDKLIADVKGLHIDSPSGTAWTMDGTWRTKFKGELTAGDLATVLPQWDYAPSLETTSTHLDADISWAGSPFNFALPIIAGQLTLKATKGRFVDVGEGGGAARIFSLLNFSAIAKRMTLDFSDVFGKGISFDKVSAVAMADQGTINLIEPMVIEGTGGNFHINGSVNFVTGALDNEMLVTLPVTSSLPWYAAYLGFVNPLAAGAVLVGERIFRNQIEKFSSAKYKVTGTIQDPKVTFVQVFPKAMDEPTVTAAETPTPADGAPPQVSPPSGGSVQAAPEGGDAPGPPQDTVPPTKKDHDA